MDRIKLRVSAKKNPQVASYLEAARRGASAQHVVPSDNGWQIKKVGDSQVSGTFNTQKEAIERAKKIAKSQKTELFIHGRDGKIRERNSYGKDPISRKG